MGHVMAGESSMDSVIREVFEEINVKLNDNEINFIKRYKWEDHKLFIDIWLIYKDIDINSMKLPQNEVSELKYVSKGELIEMFKNQSVRRTWRPKEYIEVINNMK